MILYLSYLYRSTTIENNISNMSKQFTIIDLINQNDISILIVIKTVVNSIDDNNNITMFLNIFHKLKNNKILRAYPKTIFL